MTKLTIEELANFCKRKGIIFPAAEIYGGLSGFFDIGPLGVEIQNNIKNIYRKELIQKRDDMVEQDGSIITNPKVWKASGHLDSFGDMILITEKTKTKLRADHFIEDELKISTDGMGAKEIQALIDKHNLTYRGEKFEQIKDFNLLFPVKIGADESKDSISYLRGETCQSIFPNFKLIADVCRKKLPFGIMQIGKAFRNEISPRDFLFRTREFEQIEIEYFFNPKSKFNLLKKEHLNTKFQFLSAESQEKKSDEMVEMTIEKLIKSKKVNEIHGYWIAKMLSMFQNEMGMSYKNLRIREHVKTELSHYSAGTFDVDYKYPHGFKEMTGIANRTNFDLKQHQKYSKSKLELFDEETGEKLLPHCIEPSFGIGRHLLAILCDAYTKNEKGNTILKLPPKLAPIKVAIFPLVKKDTKLIQVAKDIYKELQQEWNVSYDESGSIGRRYARNDEIGTPFCVTIDSESAEKNDVTIRNRDDGEQKRVKIDELKDILGKLISGEIEF
ncbi:MAG: glycine--tRNA ligase [archaeon]